MTDKEIEYFKNLEEGKTFICGSKKLKVTIAVPGGCDGCIFNQDSYACWCELLCELGIIPECFGVNRKDGKTVIFEEVENEKN